MNFRSKKLFLEKTKQRKTKKQRKPKTQKPKQKFHNYKKGGNPYDERFYLGKIQYDDLDWNTERTNKDKEQLIQRISYVWSPMFNKWLTTIPEGPEETEKYQKWLWLWISRWDKLQDFAFGKKLEHYGEQTAFIQQKLSQIQYLIASLK